MSSNNQVNEFFTMLNDFRETINQTSTNILPTTNSTQNNTDIFINNLDSTQITVLPNLWLLSTYGTMIEVNTPHRQNPISYSNNNPILHSNNNPISNFNNNTNLRSNFNSRLNGATAPILISPVLQNIHNNSTIPFLNISSTEQVSNAINTIVESITEIINENEEPVFNKDAVITTPPFGARAPRLRHSEPMFDSLSI
jgi:hypothetical protein